MGKQKKTQLLREASTTFLGISAVLMIAGTVILYFYTKSLLGEEVEEDLYSTESRIENSLQNNNAPFSLFPAMEAKKTSELLQSSLKDTVIYDPYQEEDELFRELITYKSINGSFYKITVRNLVVESNEILVGIVITYFFIFSTAFLFLFYFNNKRNKKLWAPFFKNLEEIKNFSITSSIPPHFEESHILEFTELNKQISLLMNKVKDDYENLKQFTEDVSHEIQTPLAIMQAKIENLINEQGITEMEYEQFSSIQKDIQRLKQFNKRLTLLTKIDNNQFILTENVNINKAVQKNIEDFKELSPTKIEFYSDNELMAIMDPYLSEILCTNLVSNAIKHTKSDEPIKIAIQGNVLTVSNYGQNALKYPAKLFQRFYREAKNVQSSGLGLAIVKKICDLYGFSTDYDFQENRHIFKITFINARL